MNSFESIPLGDFAFSWKMGKDISVETSRRVLFYYQALKNSKAPFLESVTDIVPTYLSLTLYFKREALPLEEKIQVINDYLNQLDYPKEGFTISGDKFTLPVVYNGEDLSRVAEFHGISVDEVIEIHSTSEYQVAMIGFKPHFPYLIGLSSRLETPRLETPRVKVSAGSVAIGGAQTGIYPEESPGGWNLLGMTNPQYLKKLRPGDRVCFVPVKSEKEFEDVCQL